HDDPQVHGALRRCVGGRHGVPGMGVAAVMFSLAAFEISLGPIFWLMISEIFPLRARGKATAVATVCNWTFNFLVSSFFLLPRSSSFFLVLPRHGEGHGQDWTFWQYAIFGAGALVFFGLKVPETKERSSEEIEGEIRVEQPGGRAAA
ncbi:MAG TPA: MFS transporter, partial [Acidimicrobiales bacterium]|nr:MFS transporter [Acidimicrobiales bacterium]